jgi:hypothetical protein
MQYHIRWRKCQKKIYVTHWQKKYPWHFLTSLSLYIFTISKCKSIIRNESGRFGALKSDSTHHFFRNACTKSGSLRFSQFSGCWLILPVYIIMSLELNLHVKRNMIHLNMPQSCTQLNFQLTNKNAVANILSTYSVNG